MQSLIVTRVEGLVVMANDLFVGEQILWAGQPQQVKIAWSEASFAVVGLTISVLVAVAYIPTVLGDFFLTKVILAAGILGAASFAARALIVSPLILRTTDYRITDRRILVESNWRAHRCDGFYLDQIGEPEIRPRRNGAAELVFPVSHERRSQRTPPHLVGSDTQAVSPVVLRGLGQAYAEHAQTIAVRAREKWAIEQVPTERAPILVPDTSRRTRPVGRPAPAGPLVLWL
jgi:hypothetical protein